MDQPAETGTSGRRRRRRWWTAAAAALVAGGVAVGLAVTAGPAARPDTEAAAGPLLVDDEQAQSDLQTTLADLHGDGRVTTAALGREGVGSAPSVAPGQVAGTLAGTGLTLAAYSRAGRCWYVWSDADTTVYGLRTPAVSCPAPALATAPAATTAAGIEWSVAGFPSAG